MASWDGTLVIRLIKQGCLLSKSSCQYRKFILKPPQHTLNLGVYPLLPRSSFPVLRSKPDPPTPGPIIWVYCDLVNSDSSPLIVSGDRVLRKSTGKRDSGENMQVAFKYPWGKNIYLSINCIIYLLKLFRWRAWGVRFSFFFSFQCSYKHLRIIKLHFLNEISGGQVLLYHGELHRLTFLANLLRSLRNSLLQVWLSSLLCVLGKRMEELTVLIFYDFSTFLLSLVRMWCVWGQSKSWLPED